VLARPASSRSSAEPVATAATRRLLPREVTHADATHTAGRAGLLVAALTGRPDLLLAATEDRLHQPYRAPAMPQTAALVTRLRAAGYAAVVSGAGPTVLVLHGRDAPAPAAPPGWRQLVVPVDRQGARVVG
jgi:homoserine kinase